jgi:hypothetical protein
LFALSVGVAQVVLTETKKSLVMVKDIGDRVAKGHIDEASSGTRLVPSLDREWLLDDELPPSVVRHDSAPVPTSPSPTINPPVHREPSPCRLSPEGDIIPLPTDEPASGVPPTSQEEMSSPEREPTSTSKYWDEKLPEKRRRRPNPKYAPLWKFKNPTARPQRKCIDGIRLDKNALQEAPTYYSRMMALLQLATDPFLGEIDGGLYPCLLSTKASQADNPSYKEAMNGPHMDDYYQGMVTEL